MTTAVVRSERQIARHKILTVANRERKRVQPYYMRQIQQAVCKCRRKGLVDDATLIAAGYNP